MKKIKYFSIFIIIVINKAYSQNNETVMIKSDESYEYYYAFIEATKNMIYQNYGQALNIYKRCYEYNPSSAALNFQLSKLYYLYGKQDEALYYGKQATDIDKDNKWYLINLLNLYQANNQIDSAIKINEKLIEIETDNLNNYFNLSILYQINRESKKALEVYNKIEKEYSGVKEIYINKYNILRKIKNNRKAIKELENGLKNIPDDNDILLLKAEYYRDLKKYKKAEPIYNKLINNEKRDLSNIFSFIEFLLKSNKKNEALNKLQHIIESKYYENNQIIFNLIKLIENTNGYDNDVILYDNIVEMLFENNKEDIEVLRFYIDFEMKIKNYEKASDKLKILINKEENNYRYWEQLIFVENLLKRYDNVLKYAENAIEIFKNQQVLYIYKGIAFQQLNEYLKAVDILEKGLKINENSNLKIQFYILLAESYYKIENFTNSFKYFEKALELDESNIILRNNYAYYLALQNKDLEKAEKLSKNTIEKEKKNYIYLDTYAYIMFKLNQLEKAKYFIKKAIKYGGRSNKEIVDHYELIMNKN